MEEKKIVNVNGVGDVEVVETETDDVIQIDIPKEVHDAGPEAIKNFKDAASGKGKTAGKTYNERMEWNKQEEERQEKAKEQRESNKKLKAENDKLKHDNERFQNSQRIKKDVPSSKEIFLKKLGKENLSDDDYSDAKEDNPELYESAIDERQEMLIVNAQMVNTEVYNKDISKKMIESTIRTDGFNISDVESYQRQWGFNSLEQAYAMFRTKNKPKPRSQIDIINAAEATKNKTIQFIDAGDVRVDGNLKLEDMTADEIVALPYDHPLKVARRKELNH